MLLKDFLNLFELSYFRVYLHYNDSKSYDNYSKEYLLTSIYSNCIVKKVISFWQNYCDERIIEIVIEL